MKSDTDPTTELAKAFCNWTLPKSSISYSHFLVLRFLAEAADRGYDVWLRHIADALGTSTAAVTSMVDTMEKNGLVERVRNKADRRQVNLVATQIGVASALHWTNEFEAIWRLQNDCAKSDSVRLEVLKDAVKAASFKFVDTEKTNEKNHE